VTIGEFAAIRLTVNSSEDVFGALCKPCGAELCDSGAVQAHRRHTQLAISTDEEASDAVLGHLWPHTLVISTGDC
jgi:hypothetical protein